MVTFLSLSKVLKYLRVSPHVPSLPFSKPPGKVDTYHNMLHPTHSTGSTQLQHHLSSTDVAPTADWQERHSTLVTEPPRKGQDHVTPLPTGVKTTYFSGIPLSHIPTFLTLNPARIDHFTIPTTQELIFLHKKLIQQNTTNNFGSQNLNLTLDQLPVVGFKNGSHRWKAHEISHKKGSEHRYRHPMHTPVPAALNAALPCRHGN